MDLQFVDTSILALHKVKFFSWLFTTIYSKSNRCWMCNDWQFCLRCMICFISCYWLWTSCHLLQVLSDMYLLSFLMIGCTSTRTRPLCDLLDVIYMYPSKLSLFSSDFVVRSYVVIVLLHHCPGFWGELGSL